MLAVLLPIVRARLRRNGFQATVEWSMRVRPVRSGSRADPEHTVALVKSAAERVFRWHPVPNKCLEQSLLVCRFLSRRGIKAELRIAVRKYPFESHAWALFNEEELTAPPHGDPDHSRVIATF